MALHQTVDAETLACYKEHAQEYYPEDDPDTALNKWVIDIKLPKVFFLNEAGERCVWGEDIQYIHNWCRREPGHYYQQTVDTRHFYLRRYKLSMKQIDRPKKSGMLFAHPSERGWRLPRTHRRHFLNFPQEIQDQILREILAAPKQTCVLPSVITCNWGTKWNMPHFDLGRSWRVSNLLAIPTQTAWIGRKDDSGPYLEVRLVHQAMIDATVLRTSKHFHSTWSNVLYGNSFFFNMADTAWRGCHPSCLPGGIVIRPWGKKKPDPNSWGTVHNQVISFIERSVPPEQLPGYVYYDQFLRFLHFIGPKNAARLKTLEFSGFVRRHHCYDEHCNQSEEEFLTSMRFYIPLINKFCTGMEKLILRARGDSLECYGGPVAPEAATHEEAMLSFLENELRTISTLKVLEVASVDDGDVSFAEPTILWLKERNARRIREEMEEEAKKQWAASVRANHIRCGFCGEGHVWAECYNLCNFCGGFGHFRKNCPALAS